MLKYFNKNKNKKLGLALGGGATRGFAIFPILNNLIDLGIKFEYVSGTSVGSIIGAYYCLNEEIETLYEKLSAFNKKDWLKLADLSYGIGKPIIKGEKIKNLLLSIFQKKTFNDLKVPLIIAATNLNTGKIEYISEGKIVDAIQASIAYPVIFPPHKIKKHHYIDGGVLDILPFQILLNKGMKKVVAINLSHSFSDKHTDYNNVFHILSRTFDIVFNESFKREFADKKKLFIFSPKFKKTIAGIWDIREIDFNYKAGKKEWNKKKDELDKWLKSS